MLLNIQKSLVCPSGLKSPFMFSTQSKDPITKEEIDKTIIKHELDLLLVKIPEWGEVAIEKIKNIYTSHNLPKEHLYDHIDFFLDMFDERELANYIVRKKDIKIYIQHQERFKKITIRKALVKFIIKYKNFDTKDLPKFTQKEIVGIDFATKDVKFLIERNLYDFDEEFFKERPKLLCQFSKDYDRYDTFLTILKIYTTSLDTNQVKEYYKNVAKRYQYEGGVEESNDVEQYIFDRLLELHKAHVLMEEMAPTGICGKLVIERLEAKNN